MFLSTFSLVAFCLCCRFLLRAVVTPVPVTTANSAYKRSALKVRKVYSVFAWSLLTSSFLFSLVVSFVQVYTTL